MKEECDPPTDDLIERITANIAKVLAAKDAEIATLRVALNKYSEDEMLCAKDAHDNKLFALGWISAASWAGRHDLIADIDSPAYLYDRNAARGTT